MRLHRRLTAAGLSAVMISSITAMPALAYEHRPYEWDGVTPLAENMTYYITESVVVNGSFTLPESSEIKIQSGAGISIPYGSSLSLSGDMTVEKGAGAVVSGSLEVSDGADFSVYGYLAAGGKSLLNLKGNMFLNKGSSASLDGETNLAQAGSFSSLGNVFIGGKLTTRSDFNVYDGAVTVTGSADFGGDTDLSGLFRIADGADILNSGELVLNENCRYFLEGYFANLQSGFVTDNRKLYDESSTDASRLALYSTTTPLKGIDVSVWQGDIDWQKVKQDGIDFAIIRSSRGPISEELPMTNDENFHQNMLGAVQNDIPVGVYHYCYGETIEQVREEANFVLSLVEGYDLKYPIIFDIEDEWYIKQGYTRKELTDMTIAFCEVIKDAGYIPMVYSYASFFDAHLDMQELAEYPVWVAHVGVDVPDHDGLYFLWQYSWEGNVDGIEGNVDMDYSYLDFAKYTEQFSLNRQ